MALPGFIFGGDTGVTPDKLKRDRAIAEAMLAGAQRNGAPRNVGEGLSAVGQALMYRVAKGRADKGGEVEAQKREGIWKDLQAGFGATGMLGAPAPSSSTTVPFAASSPGGGTASIPSGERAAYIRNGLTSRGLPEHVADGFLANFQDESGMDPGINEAKPLVPGSRGGFGLYQLTGPRRREYEAFASQRGVDPSDIDAQLDFMMGELQGSERKAGQRILGAPDTASAAQAIVNDFLRPAPEHRASRTARYARLDDVAAQIGVAHDPSRPHTPSQVDLELIARTMQGGGTQVASLDPSIGMAQSASPKDAAVGQALGLAPTTQSARLSPAAAALNGIAPQAPAAQPQQAMAAQPAPQPQQYAQAQPQGSAGGVDARALLSVLSDPWASDEQRQVAQFLMQQQMSQQEAAQKRAFEQAQQRQLWAREDARNSVTDRREDARLGMEMGQFEREGSKPIEVNGVLLDPQTYQPVYQAPAEGFTLNSGQTRFDGDGRQIAAGAPKAPNVPTGVQEYQFAVSQGYTGSFADWEQSNRRAGATTINTGQDEGEFQKKAAGRMVERFGALADAGIPAASTLQTIPQMRELLTIAPQGPVQGRLAEMFPGFSTAADAFTATVNQIAPSLRIPGSGAQSDKDMDILLGSFPRMRNNPEGNIMIMDAFETKARINLQRSEIATAALRGELTPAEADRRIAELDRTSIIPEGFRNRLGIASGETPDSGITPSVRPRATNPQTGEIIEFDGTQWVPAQ